MTTHKPPGTGAARHGSGDADLTLMISAHQAFSRDLVSLARAAGPADLANPVRRQAVGNGWRVFKRQLHAHHRSEDEFIWPTLGGRCPTATALPLIGTALTGAEWEAAGRRIARSNGLSAGRRVLCLDTRRRPARPGCGRAGPAAPAAAAALPRGLETPVRQGQPLVTGQPAPGEARCAISARST